MNQVDRHMLQVQIFTVLITNIIAEHTYSACTLYNDYIIKVTSQLKLLFILHGPNRDKLEWK